jgi:hypothetical protein
MTSAFSTQVIEGQLKKVETINYSNGAIAQRVYEQPQDAIPMEVHWVKGPAAIDIYACIEHREVELYKTYYKIR